MILGIVFNGMLVFPCSILKKTPVNFCADLKRNMIPHVVAAGIPKGGLIRELVSTNPGNAKKTNANWDVSDLAGGRFPLPTLHLE